MTTEKTDEESQHPPAVFPLYERNPYIGHGRYHVWTAPPAMVAVAEKMRTQIPASVCAYSQASEAPKPVPTPEQPEPVAFCSDLELDGDPPPSAISVREVLLFVGALVVGFCLAASLLSCSPAAQAPGVTRSYAACASACRASGCSREEREKLCSVTRRLP